MYSIIVSKTFLELIEAVWNASFGQAAFIRSLHNRELHNDPLQGLSAERGTFIGRRNGNRTARFQEKKNGNSSDLPFPSRQYITVPG
jgi:hypothetical protein